MVKLFGLFAVGDVLLILFVMSIAHLFTSQNLAKQKCSACKDCCNFPASVVAQLCHMCWETRVADQKKGIYIPF